MPAMEQFVFFLLLSTVKTFVVCVPWLEVKVRIIVFETNTFFLS